MKAVLRYHGILLGLIALASSRWTMSHPLFVERYYSRGLYRIFREIYDATLGYLPFASVYLVVPMLLVWLVRPLWLRRGQGNIKSMLHIIHVIGWVLFLFYTLWGYNYSQPRVSQQLDLDLVADRDDARLEQEVYRVTRLLVEAREGISIDTVAIGSDVLPTDMEAVIRPHLLAVLTHHDLPAAGRPRVRRLQPAGILLRIGTAGVYLPPAMEGHYDAGLHPIQQPYTLAHEMAHGYSVTDEGECNFLALLACMRSDRLIIRYSALRVYWLYLMRELAYVDRTCYRIIYDDLPPAVLNDFRAIEEQMGLYPDILPRVRDWIYDSYLRSNGVSGGMRSYGQVVGLALSYQDRYGVID